MIHVKKGQLGPKVCVKEWLIYWPNGVFGFAVLGIELAKYPWQCISWKNGNSWWICEVKKSVLKLLRLAIRKILLVYDYKRESAWWLPYLLSWKENTHIKLSLLKLVDIWFRSREIDHLWTVMATYVFLSLWEGKEKSKTLREASFL